MKKLKTILIVWAAIYPTISIIYMVFGSFLNTLPILIRTLVLTMVLVPAMVLVLIPFWTRLINKGIDLIQKR